MIHQIKPVIIRSMTIVLAIAASQSQAALIDFENQISGDIVNTINASGVDVTFSSNVTDAGLDLITSSTGFSGNATTSGVNYLGVNDGSIDLFIAGDVIDLSFSQKITEFSASFITVSNTFAGTLGIRNKFETVLNGTPDAFLGTDEVFTLSLFNDTPFSEVSLFANPGGLLSFNVDDIEFTAAVPIPPSLMLFMSGLFG